MLADTDRLLFAEIAERRADPELDSREDILSLLVAARFEDGSRMEDRELRDQLMTLLMAGHETTATALAWAFDLLFRAPAKLQRLREEVDDGGHDYLDAVIEETLRVRPVVPFVGRQLRVGAELGGYRLPAGTVVMPAIYLTHTRADLYAEPVRVPARALPGRRDRDLQLDPVRRRHPTVHRRGVRAARDAGGPRDDPPACGSAAGHGSARANGSTQRHPVAARGHSGGPGRPPLGIRTAQRLEPVEQLGEVGQVGGWIEHRIPVNACRLLRSVESLDQQVPEARALVPCALGQLLDDPVRVVALHPGLHQRGQRPLAVERSVRQPEVVAHPLGVHGHLARDTGGDVLHVVEQDGGVGQDRPARHRNGRCRARATGPRSHSPPAHSHGGPWPSRRAAR